MDPNRKLSPNLIVRCIALAATYFVIARLGMLFAHAQGVVSLVWPASGLALAAMLLDGRRLWPGVAVGAFLANWSTGAALGFALAAGLGNTLEAVAGSWLLERIGRFRIGLDRVRDVWNLALYGAFLGTAVSAAIGVAGLCASGMEAWDAYASIAWTWWLGDAMGALLVSPALLLWLKAPRDSAAQRAWREPAVALALLTLAAQLVFSGWLSVGDWNPSFAYALFPLLLWIALRLHRRWAAAAVLVTSVVAVVGTAGGHGPLVGPGVVDSLAMSALFLSVIALTTLSISAAMAQQRHLAEGLQRSEDRYGQLVTLCPDAIFINQRNRITYVNPAAVRLFGASDPSELLGRSPFELIHPDHHALVHMRFDALRTPGASNALIEERIVRLNGDLVDVEASSCSFPDDGGVSIQVVMRDITARKVAEAERRQLEAQIQHAQKLESLSVLAGGVAHDFNNLLTGILGNASLARTELPPDATAARRIALIEKASHRAADLCRQMLAYSGKGRFVVEPVDLSAVVRDILGILEVSISRKVALRLNLAADLPAVEADSSQMQQIAINLITNASEAIGETGGLITLATGRLECDAAYLRRIGMPQSRSSEPCVFFEISDTGCGMNDATRVRIFEPFFSTKFVGRGLGLAAVQGIVRAHGGAIDVDSEPGRGTRVRVVLPASGRTTTPRIVHETDRRPAHGGSGTVLVADDEETVLTLAKSVLEVAGYRVLTAADGRETLEVFRRHAGQVRAVLLDLTMPHLSGQQVFRSMRELRPDLPVILSSAHCEADALDRFEGDAPDGFLQKPYSCTDLLEKFRLFAPACETITDSPTGT